jgi:hypothetical protein
MPQARALRRTPGDAQVIASGNARDLPDMRAVELVGRY